MFKRTSDAPRRFIAAIGAAALFILFVTTASAQRFMTTYGSPVSLGCGTTGHNGVQQCSSGGYIAAGYTLDTLDPNLCSQTFGDIYVVRTGSDGTALWETRIDLSLIQPPTPQTSLPDSATCVRECANGDFIVAGVTLSGHPSMYGSWDIFLVRLDPNGTVIWVNTYGEDQLNEWTFDVIETTTGPTSGAVRQGDFVIAGFQTEPPAGSPANAILYRIDANGNPVWQNTYRFGTDIDERFHALDECTYGVPAGTSGDIVAVGQTDAYSATTDAFIARVDPNNGGFTGGFHGVAAIDGGAFETFYAVQELTLGASAGDIVAAGSTTSRNFPSTSSEVFVVQSQANPSFPLVANRVFGDDGSQGDFGYSIKQVTVGNLNVGNVIVAGTAILPGGFGGSDGFLQEMVPGFLNLVGPITLYGTTDAFESILSVNEVAPMATVPATTAGYILCGQTAGFSTNPSRRLWLIKTDAAKSSYCHSTARSASQEIMQLTTSTTPPDYLAKESTWDVLYTEFHELWENEICYVKSAARQENPNNGSDGVSTVEPGGEAAISEAAIAPNPVRAGSSFTVGFPARAAGVADVVVSDVKGNVLVQASSEHEAGDAGVAVDTKGWAAGTYIVRIETGGRVMTTRVVVVD